MSTVLWANVLDSGQVTCEEADYPALYKHADKLDKLSRQLGLTPFLSACDTTDLRFNMDALTLPDGMTSTVELMAVQGLWIDAAAAIALLQGLHRHITEHQVRFGLLSNQHGEVVAELAAALAFAQAEAGPSRKFNFGIVM